MGEKDDKIETHHKSATFSVFKDFQVLSLAFTYFKVLSKPCKVAFKNQGLSGNVKYCTSPVICIE